MRPSAPDDYVLIEREVGGLEKKAGDLRAARDRLEADERIALGREKALFSEDEVRRLRRERASVAERLAVLSDRLAAKRAQLPSEKQRRAANAKAVDVLAQVRDASQRFRGAWERYMAAMETAEQAASEVSAARSQSRTLIAGIEDLRARFGLDVAVPGALESPDAKVAWLLGTLLAQAAHDAPDDTVTNGLASARRQILQGV
jgi:hypothetical protein